jgi:acetyl/propionyl-CoA carboxylase alpha subunit/acetyl-CoA carboxylase carboxyltransferase component
MPSENADTDLFFQKAERLATDASLAPQSGQLRPQATEGLLSDEQIRETCKELKKLDIDAYIERTVMPSEDKSRPGVKSILKKLDMVFLKEISDGPLYAAEVLIDFKGDKRRLALLAQERSVANGVWMPKHHNKAVELIRDYAQYSIPIVTFIDTPGADAGEEANSKNQAHSISHLIAEMANVDLPTVGIIFGNGYSGGAIPLATTNLLLSVRDGVFNTIQPRGLASIARKYDLSWQECAKYVGVSAYELYQQGYVDGIIDYVPGEKGDKIYNLQKAIVSALLSIEEKTADFVRQNDYVFDHYRSSISRYLNPTESLKKMENVSTLCLAKHPTGQVNVFGVTYRYLRYLTLRGRISSTTVSRYGRLSDVVKPLGDFSKRREEELRMAFSSWVANPLQVKYDDLMDRFLKNYEDKRAHAEDRRNRVARLIYGDPKTNFELARDNLGMVYGFHLYNTWKAGSQSNFLELLNLLNSPVDAATLRTDNDQTVLDVIRREDLRAVMASESRCFIVFDTVYDHLISNLRSIAREAKNYNVISKDSVARLVEDSLQTALKGLSKLMPADSGDKLLKEEFSSWIRHLVSYPKRASFLKSVEEWKKIVHPRVSEPLFAILTFFFEQLLPRYYESEDGAGAYDGRVNPKSIGIKDFWNRLQIAYTDLLVQEVQLRDKKQTRSANEIIQHFFYDFKELEAELISRDPVKFPGFRISIEQALDKGIRPCGIVTGIGRLRQGPTEHRVGVVVSNLDFQAGAFDMASGEKFCRLLVECAVVKCPVVCFISSGGMQTKEGAGALFSMSIVNDRITRFVRDNNLPIICFGYGDCTGGAQASFVTHPLVQTYYFSGTNMPFAGQIVVPSYLPSTATLSNYLSKLDGSMKGLVKHPFNQTIDNELYDIDPAMPLPTESVGDVCQRVLIGVLSVKDTGEAVSVGEETKIFRKVEKVLIHARGCTAVKLIRIAQQQNISVVLAQSDADMDSVPAEMLGPNDTLVCIGGNTPDESYLNAMSILRIAEQENVDSLHPGIGFLSENSSFARLCANHQLNFVGPDINSMELMGNKSNAINTARRCNVPVVPGSHGILSDVDSAIEIAERIGYPVLIKAVHGGGGKGIQVVEEPSKFAEYYHRISAEARSAFGSGDLYLEKYVTSLRHVEVQILRDSHGNTRILGLRDCSVQRNNQKIIEESTSTMLPADLEESVYTYARSLADEIKYIGAGTVEFIFDLANMAIYFMEMNTRLQVEHPVTESVTGIDIVAAQFNIASGGNIADMVPNKLGYAMEIRITAEKAVMNDHGEIKFMPHPGQIIDMVVPKMDAVQVISMVEKGKVISPYYDSLIMQVIATGRDRKETIDTMYRYLDKLIINGVCTNIPMVKKILKDKTFIKGVYDTNFLKGFLGRIDAKALIEEIESAAGEDTCAVNLDSLKIEGSDEIKVLSAQAGIFYLTPSPSEPEFVHVGKVIGIEDTLCLMEAMKLFSAITLGSFGKEDHPLYPAGQYEVVRVVPVSGQAVNRGDLLFVIKPVAS